MDGWMDGWCTVCSGYLVKASPVNIQRQRVFRFGIASHVYEHVITLWGDGPVVLVPLDWQ